MSDINWNASLSTTGTVLSTGANIYLSIQQGEIKAIEAENKANQVRFRREMAELDKRSKIDQINLQYEEQTAVLANEMSGATENQMMTAMMQGRTMDSLASVQSTDERQYKLDTQKTLLNRDYQVNQAEADSDLQSTMSKIDENNLRASGNITKKTAKINAAKTGIKGLTTLGKNNAFSADTYKKD